jgi:Ca2+-binding RTX toxin-like protein
MLGTNVDVPDKEPKTPKPKPDPNVWMGTNGNDTVNGSNAKDYLKYYGLGGNDTITGGAKDNLIDGGDGDDILDGGNGADTLIGGNGNDQLFGGFKDNAVDILTGGSGADRFHLNASGGVADIITDFNPAEGDQVVIEFAGIPPGYTPGIWKSAFCPYTSNDFSYNQSSGALSFNDSFHGLAPVVIGYLPPNLGNDVVSHVNSFSWSHWNS